MSPCLCPSATKASSAAWPAGTSPAASRCRTNLTCSTSPGLVHSASSHAPPDAHQSCQEWPRVECDSDPRDPAGLDVGPVDNRQRSSGCGAQFEPGQHIRSVDPALDDLDAIGHGEHTA